MNKIKKQMKAGFTLLELLIVVAILAAIAGTATIALQDTDARAAAAAHVAMMDELGKGVRSFRVLNKNTMPNNFDSLVATTNAPAAGTPVTGGLISIAAIEDVELVPLTADVLGILNDVGITELQYIDANLDDGPEGDPNEDCSDLEGIVASRKNHFVAGNIFLTPAGNGCGVARVLEAGDEVAFWTGGQERITGQPGPTGEFDGTNLATATGKAYLAVGLGPASTLFSADNLGSLTTVPVYRHVGATEYNRFVALFDVGSFDGAGGIITAPQVTLAAIVDGAGDTKEEELGEWDGTRNTI